MKKLLVPLFLLVTYLYAPIVVVHADTNAWTLGQLEERARKMIRDDDSTNYRYSATDMAELFWMAEEKFCRDTQAVKSQEYIVTVTSQTEYSLPTGWIQTDRVSRAVFPLQGSTTYYKAIDYVTIGALDSPKGRPYFENPQNAGTPERYYINLWTHKIGLDPPPDVDYTGSNLIKHEYSIISSSMAASTDIPFDNKPYLYSFHKCLIFYVVALCEKDAGNDAAYVTNLQIFDAYVMQAKELINAAMHDRKGALPAR